MTARIAPDMMQFDVSMRITCPVCGASVDLGQFPLARPELHTDLSGGSHVYGVERRISLADVRASMTAHANDDHPEQQVYVAAWDRYGDELLEAEYGER